MHGSYMGHLDHLSIFLLCVSVSLVCYRGLIMFLVCSYHVMSCSSRVMCFMFPAKKSYLSCCSNII
jgi:hypothetical protein